jgi:NADPH:quinone reductase-like Zn-dependent oxidoreductase
VFKSFLRYRLPLVLGHDVAGVVIRVGSRVRRFTPGDDVYARPADGRIGTFAEFIAIKEDDVAMKPASLTMSEAASIPLVGLTAWQALIERANLQSGQKVLIHAGAGGVGTFAIQLAKHAGATVATTTSTNNVDLVRRLGADVVVDYIDAREISARPRLRRTPDLYLRPTRCHLCEKYWRVMGLENRHGCLKPQDSRTGKAPARALFVSVHESERWPVGQDHVSDR